MLMVYAIIWFALCEAFTTRKPVARTREETIMCGMKYSDLDRDGRLSTAEVTKMRYYALGSFRQAKAGALWVAERVFGVRTPITVAQIFADCDANNDGYITFEDYAQMRDTCLDSQGKIDDAYHYICEQGDMGIFAHVTLD